MASRRERRKDRVSTARRRAQQHGSGYETSLLKMPEGLGFWEIKPGTHRVSVIPYTAGKGNPFAEAGELHYERTFFAYRNVGPEQKRFIAPGKTFGHKDFIVEWRQAESKKAEHDEDTVKGLAPKERQIFLFFDHDEPDKGLQLFEFSYHKFGKLLDARIDKSPEERGWDMFYFPDEDGFMLELTVEETPPYGNDVIAIDFIERDDPLPKEIVEHGICLDDLLLEPTYNQLKAAFLGMDVEDVEKESGSGESPRRPREIDSRREEPSQETPRRETPKPTSKEEPKKEEPKKADPTAEEKGLKNGDYVRYEGKKCSIWKISPDGTSLTLMDEDDDPIKAVSPSEVEKIEEELLEPVMAGAETEKEAPFEADGSAGDGDWDTGDDWD